MGGSKALELGGRARLRDGSRKDLGEWSSATVRIAEGKIQRHHRRERSRLDDGN